MDVTDDGMNIDFNLEQRENAPTPMDVMRFGRSIEVNPVLQKALSPI